MSIDKSRRTIASTGVICSLCLMIMGITAAGSPVNLPYATNFDGYAVGTALNTLGAQGWWASSNAVVITNDAYYSGHNAVLMPQASQVTNDVIASGLSNLWTEVYVNESSHMDQDRPDINSNAAVMVCMDQSGCLALYDPVNTNWVVCTNDAWGGNVTAFFAGGWAQIDVHENFSNKQAAIFLNDRCIRDRWPFINTNAVAYSGLRLDSGSTNLLHFDDINIGMTPPVTLINDWDQDGVCDAAEVQTYGSISRWVGTRMVTNGMAIQSALDLVLPAERIVIQAGTYVETVTISNAVPLFGTNVTITGALTVTGGVSVTLAQVSNLVVSGAVTIFAGSSLILTNGTLTLGALSIGEGGQLLVTNGTVVINGLILTGTFSLDSSWQGVGLVPAALPVLDGFELYGAGTPLGLLGYYSWTASSVNSLIQSTAVKYGTKAVEVNAGTLISNAVVADAVSSNVVWTDVYLNEATHMDADRPDVNTNSTVMTFIDQSKHLVIYNPAVTNWVVCTNDVWGNDIAGLYAGGWVRITLHQNFNSHTTAIFMNDHLVFEQLQFINTNCHVFAGVRLDGGVSGPAFLDGVRIQASIPSDLIGNVDGDDIPDALEIQTYGSALLIRNAAGTVFKLR